MTALHLEASVDYLTDEMNATTDPAAINHILEMIPLIRDGNSARLELFSLILNTLDVTTNQISGNDLGHIRKRELVGVRESRHYTDPLNHIHANTIKFQPPSDTLLFASITLVGLFALALLTVSLIRSWNISCGAYSKIVEEE